MCSRGTSFQWLPSVVESTRNFPSTGSLNAKQCLSSEHTSASRKNDFRLPTYCISQVAPPSADLYMRDCSPSPLDMTYTVLPSNVCTPRKSTFPAPEICAGLHVSPPSSDRRMLPLDPATQTIAPLRRTTTATPRKSPSTPAGRTDHQEPVEAAIIRVQPISNRIRWESIRISANLLLGGGNAGGYRGARVWVLGTPILGRERNAPEGWTRLGELQSYLRFPRTHGAQEHHRAFLLFLGLLVLHQNLAAAGEPRLQLHQRSMRINCQCGSFFFELFALDVVPAGSDWHLH